MTLSVMVSSIFIYPIKSCGSVALRSAQLEPRGFALDRRWMLIDSTGRFLSQREVPRMALLRVSVEHDHLAVRGRDGSSTTIPLTSASGPTVRVGVWADTLDAESVSVQTDAWFSEQLGTSCRLVHMPESARRRVDQSYASPEDHVSFADAYPVLVTTEASLDELNRRLPSPVPMDRFRPNIVLRGTAPFAEDGWSGVRFPNAQLRLAKPCARCVITTIDQSTGDRGPEPLATLATFRSAKNKVLFGQNAIPVQCGTIAVGDPVIAEPAR